MEPITLAISFATVISLLATYKSENKSSENISEEAFYEWLIDNNQQEIKNLLASNQNTTISIKALLNENTNILLEKLNKIDSITCTIASNIDGFKELSNLFNKTTSLSDQAQSILI